MAPSLRGHSSFVRPPTRERPATRDQQHQQHQQHQPTEHSLVIPSRTSSLHSRITQPIPGTLNLKANARAPKTLTHAYMVCGLGKEPAQWVKAPPPAQGKISHMKGAVGHFWLPEILGSSPRLDQDNEIAKSLHASMRACFPHDVEICVGRNQPHCSHHAFVLQQDSSHTLYGIALRVWSKADSKRGETIRDLRRRTEPDFHDYSDETYWIPYCLSFLSRYPLYDLLGDYLRGMWIHWNKATNLFHAEEVSRILSFPAPRLNDLVRIDMKDYALCYQFPSSPTGFQNFALWPLFSCLSIPNIVGVIEAAVSPTRRIIFVSHHPAMLTMASEAIRYCVRVYEWSGLYVPVMHARHVRDLTQEPGPYILGTTAECRSLFTAPTDALVVDLDRNYVLTSNPPNSLSSRQRSKMIDRLTLALNGDVTTMGVPAHLRSAYGDGKLVPAGQIIVMRGEVESIQDPVWWNQDNVMTVMDHVCEKLSRNTGVKAIFGGAVKKPLMTKVSMRHLNEIVRERNQYSRDTAEAWQDYISLKGRMDTELSKVNKRNNFLVEELESWKQQFLKFQAFAEQLTKETQDLKSKIDHHKREHRRLTNLIDQHKTEMERVQTRLAGTEKQRDDALEALVLQQEIAEELERERKKNKKEIAALKQTNKNIIRQREEAQRVVVHLRSLISGQTHHMEHIVRTIQRDGEMASNGSDESPEDATEEGRSLAGGARSSKRLSYTRSLQSLRRAARRAGTPTADVPEPARGTPESSARSWGSSATKGKRLSETSLVDVADRQLRDKTDAIAHIIRSISDQCAAAVEGLQLAHNAEQDPDAMSDSASQIGAHEDAHVDRSTSASASASDAGNEGASDAGASQASAASGASVSSSQITGSALTPHTKHSSIPPTPDLYHARSSTAMSINSISTANELRSSQQYPHSPVVTKVVESGEDAADDNSLLAVDSPVTSKMTGTVGALHSGTTTRVL